MHREVEEAVANLIATVQKHRGIDLEASARDVLDFTPEITPIQFTVEHNRYRNQIPEDELKGMLEQDATAPFFSEAYLYNLLGKMDARTLLAHMRPIWKAAGIPRREQP